MEKFDRNDVVIHFGENPIFFVNEKKKTVACKLSGEIEAPMPISLFGTEFVFDREFDTVGVAKCQDEDTFDVVRGKRIALAKAESRGYFIAAKRIKEALKDIDFLRSAGNNFITKADKCISHNLEYIDTMSNPSNKNYIKDVYDVNKGETFFQNGSTKKRD